MQDTGSESKKKEKPVHKCIIELTMATGVQGPVGPVNGPSGIHLSTVSSIYPAFPLSKYRLNFC